MSKETTAKSEMLELIVHDIWELRNKPHRFFSSLRKSVELFHKNNEAMNAMYLAGNKSETMEEIDKLEKMFYKNRSEELNLPT